MEKVYLVSPSMEHEDAYIAMMLEWEGTNEHIYPGVIRRRGNDYNNWLENLKSYRKKETCRDMGI